MTLLKFTDVSLAFGTTPLLDKVSWQIEKGERVCIIGRNGTGKLGRNGKDQIYKTAAKTFKMFGGCGFAAKAF